MNRRWRETSTLGDLLVRTVALGANPAAGVVTPTGRATWTEVLAGAERLAGGLLDAGLGAGSRVGLLVDNSVRGIESLFACAFIGAVAVPVNTRSHPREIRHVLTDAGLHAVVVTAHPDAPANFATLLREAAPELASAGDPLALALPELPALRAVLAVADHPVDGFAPLDGPGSDADAGVRVAAARARVRLRQTALMVYTSGTTSMPRGCPLSHEALVATGIAVGRDRFRCTATDTLWDVLPLFHLSFVLPMLAVLDAGGSFATDRRFDAQRALAMIRDEAVTVAFTCFPAVIGSLLERPEFDEAFAGVRLMLNVGPPEMLLRIQQRAPHAVQLTSYGSTEAGGIAATTSPDDGSDVRLGTNGRPLPGMEIATMSEVDDVLLAAGESGELVVRGVGLFDGYHNDAPKTAEVSATGGWLRSGDLGFVDEAGRVHYRGRLKDMIKVGGENVAALEVEAALAEQPDVLTVAVVAAPDARYTEVPAAFVELRAGSDVSTEELREHCRARLARFKVPQHVRFVTEWPMSATKIQKVRLREQIAEELAATW